MLIWTDELPTDPGWYFWKPGPTTRTPFAPKGRRKGLPPGVYYLEWTGLPREEQLYLALPSDRNRYPAEWMGGSWAGPIVEPIEGTGE